MRQIKTIGTLLLSITALLLVVSWVSANNDQLPSPGSKEFIAYVMNKIDDQHRGLKSHGIMSMEVQTKHWTRSIKMEAWSMGEDYSLVRILLPKKEKGTATLKADKTLFTYLNKTGRTIKISSGMMGHSWMGSHFTNDDLVRDTRLSRDFHIVQSDLKNKETYEFILTPKPDVPVVWGKIAITVRQKDLQPVKEVFFDEEGQPVRELSFSNYQKTGNRVIPMQLTMRPLDDSGEYTKITYHNIDFDVALNKSFFSLQQLKRF